MSDVDDLVTWLMALLLSAGLGYVIQREIRYRWFRRWSPLLLAPPIVNTAPPTELDRPSSCDEWRP